MELLFFVVNSQEEVGFVLWDSVGLDALPCAVQYLLEIAERGSPGFEVLCHQHADGMEAILFLLFIWFW